MNKFNKFLETKGLTPEQFAEKSAEEMAGLYNEYNEEQRKEIEGLIESKATQKDIETAVTALRETLIKQQTALNDVLKDLGLEIKAMKENKQDVPENGVTDIRKGLKTNEDELKKLKDLGKGQTGGFSFTIKAAGTMMESTNISGGNVPVEQRIPGLNTIASRRVRLLDILKRGKATSNLISWVYQANKDGAAGGTAEGALKNQIDFDLVVGSQAVVKRTAFIKVSTEMLDDIDFIETEIRNELMRELLKNVELTAYSGNGTAPNLNGIRTVATAFAAGAFAAAVDEANEADVLVVAMNQIRIAEQGEPNYILMHPTDVTKLKLYKVSTTDRRYVDRLLLIGGELTLDGVPIIQTTLVTAGEYLIGDFDLSTLYEKEGITITMGLDGDDFTKNLRTIIAEWRGALVTKNNDRTAFVKGVFATDKAALETA